jgi:hypothetical protein
MNDKITKVAHSLGYCCPYAMLISLHKRTIIEIVALTGLSRRTIMYGFSNIRKQHLKCDNLNVEVNTCFKNKETQND